VGRERGRTAPLVDHLPDTRRTRTVATHRPRKAGAEGVFPLVLAVRTGHEALSVAHLGRDMTVILLHFTQLLQLLVAAFPRASKNRTCPPHGPTAVRRTVPRYGPIDSARTVGAYPKGGK
jgi:hypothetical protein